MRILAQQQIGEGLQSLLTGFIGTGLTVRLVGKVDIFEFDSIFAGFNPFAQFCCEFALLVDGGDDVRRTADSLRRGADP